MSFHFKIGLKLHTTNVTLIPYAIKLKKEGFFDYIELYMVPDSYRQTFNAWKDLNIPYIIHAPHSYSGLNLSLEDFEYKNNYLIEETESFRVALNPSKIIFHPGINGSIKETIRQILLHKKNYSELFKSSIIENKPKMGLNGELCIGSSPEEILQIINETEMGFCLDVGHAIYYAAWAGLNYEDVIDSYNRLKPNMYHLSDGDVSSKTDLHLNFGKGNFKLGRILKKIPKDSYITIETNKDIKKRLTDFETDIDSFNKLLI